MVGEGGSCRVKQEVAVILLLLQVTKNCRSQPYASLKNRRCTDSSRGLRNPNLHAKTRESVSHRPKHPHKLIVATRAL